MFTKKRLVCRIVPWTAEAGSAEEGGWTAVEDVVFWLEGGAGWLDAGIGCPAAVPTVVGDATSAFVGTVVGAAWAVVVATLCAMRSKNLVFSRVCLMSGNFTAKATRRTIPPIRRTRQPMFVEGEVFFFREAMRKY
jgi:hypothetical protein